MPTAADLAHLERALQLAEDALAAGQPPFGAVVADDSGAVLGEGHNTTLRDLDPTAHGEMVAIRAALRTVGGLTLPPGCTLYTSCEPCLLCTFALVRVGGIDRVVFAARGTDVAGWTPLLGADLAGAAPWITEHVRPLEVVGDVLRDRARATIDAYRG